MAAPEPKSPPPPKTDPVEAITARVDNRRDVVNRLKRIEGQVRGLIDMVERERGCEEVAQQMAAVRKAMDKAFYRMMACAVMEAVSASDSEVAAFLQVERSTRILEKYA